uniref:Small ribosomal subunit protein uS15 N-terminal domain-containing protein n=1 Tax=Vombatus ursinus TaxID=29139 RepID=A0A4X2KLG8_VOMUR
MGRMHAPGKGLSQSALLYCRSVPTWQKLTSHDVKEHIYKLAKKGLTPSQIEECYTPHGRKMIE